MGIFNTKNAQPTKVENFNIDRGRLDSFDVEIAKELNTYRWWGEFGMRVEPLDEDWKDDQKVLHKAELFPHDNSQSGKEYRGKKSIFNNVNAVPYNQTYQVNNNAPLIDTREMRAIIRQRGDCSVKELIRASSAGEMGRSIYNYSDFMYCKYLGRVSNNHMITLRRFPYPAGDHINYTFNPGKSNGKRRKLEEQMQQHMPDIGRMITWMGTPGNEMSNILKYSVLMPYKELEAQIQELDNGAEQGGLMGSLMNIANPAYVNGTVKGTMGASGLALVGSLTSSIPFVGGMSKSLTAAPPNSEWAYHRDASKPYGPVDVISKTHIRKDGSEGGLEFNQEISLQFDYELRSYDNINTKAAFLDLIGNILAVTYTNGKFWGGGYHANGPSATNAFANLPIYKLTGTSTLSDVGNAILATVSEVGRQFNNGQKINGLGDAINAVKNFASNVGSMLLGGALNALGRPHKQGLNSLLTPAPVGLWHLTIGNPKHPIMSMGNMILTGVDIEHYGPLGLDDFPTGIRVNVKLKHGKPRDAMQIEQMYNFGDYRIYSPMGKYIQHMYDNASIWKQIEDNKKQTNGNSDKTITNADINANNGQSTSSDNMDEVSEKEAWKYLKYFGTRSGKNVIWAGMEGHLGSQKAKTEEEHNRDRQQIKKAQEENKSK